MHRIRNGDWKTALVSVLVGTGQAIKSCVEFCILLLNCSRLLHLSLPESNLDSHIVVLSFNPLTPRFKP